MPTEQRIPSHLLAKPDKKKKGGFFGFGSSRKKKSISERSSESSGGGKSDSEYRSDGDSKKKKKGLFGRRKDPDSKSVNAPQVAIYSGQQAGSIGQTFSGERAVDVGGPVGEPRSNITPETSPGTPQSPHGILGTVMGAPSGSNIERSDTVRESNRKAGFFSKRKDKVSDDGEYGAVPYIEGELPEVGQQTGHYGQEQSGPIRCQGRVQHGQQYAHGYHEQQIPDDQVVFDVQEEQRSFDAATFSSVGFPTNDERKERKDENKEKPYANASGQERQRQHGHPPLGTNHGETNLDEIARQQYASPDIRNVPEHPHQQHGRAQDDDDRPAHGKPVTNVDLAAQLWSQQQGLPQIYQDQEGQYTEQAQPDRSRLTQTESGTHVGRHEGKLGLRPSQDAIAFPSQNEQGTNNQADSEDPHRESQTTQIQRNHDRYHRKDDNRNYPITDDTAAVSKMWKERDERESEMQRLLMPMSDNEMTGQPEELSDVGYEMSLQQKQPTQEVPARWGKSKRLPPQIQHQPQLTGQPALGVPQQGEQHAFEEAAFSSVTSSIEDEKRARMEDSKRGRYNQALSSQYVSNVPESESPIHRPQPVYGSLMQQPRQEHQKFMEGEKALVANVLGSQHKPDLEHLQQETTNATSRSHAEVVVMHTGNTQQKQQQLQSQEPFQRGRWGASRRSKPKRPLNCES